MGKSSLRNTKIMLGTFGGLAGVMGATAISCLYRMLEQGPTPQLLIAAAISLLASWWWARLFGECVEHVVETTIDATIKHSKELQ